MESIIHAAWHNACEPSNLIRIRMADELVGLIHRGYGFYSHLTLSLLFLTRLFFSNFFVWIEFQFLLHRSINSACIEMPYNLYGKCRSRKTYQKVQNAKQKNAQRGLYRFWIISQELFLRKGTLYQRNIFSICSRIDIFGFELIFFSNNSFSWNRKQLKFIKTVKRPVFFYNNH